MSDQQDKPHATGAVDRGDTSRRVGIETIRERGGDPEEIRDKLVSALGAEFTTYYYYTNLRTHLAGNEDYKEITEDARLEDRAHFELGMPRVYELDGKIPERMEDFAAQAACPDPELPDDPTAENILVELLEAERCAIRTWSELCDMTEGVDRRTFDISQRILNEEIDHEAWFVELLSMERDGEVNPAGHFVRSDPGEAPYSTNNRINDSA